MRRRGRGLWMRGRKGEGSSREREGKRSEESERVWDLKESESGKSYNSKS